MGYFIIGYVVLLGIPAIANEFTIMGILMCSLFINIMATIDGTYE